MRKTLPSAMQSKFISISFEDENPFVVLHCNYNGEIGENLIWSQLLTGRSYRRKVNASELHFARSFQGHPHDHILHAQICAPNTIFGIFCHIWAHIWAHQIWSSGVSLKRSCKTQFRLVGVIGQEVKSYDQISFCIHFSLQGGKIKKKLGLPTVQGK